MIVVSSDVTYLNSKATINAISCLLNRHTLMKSQKSQSYPKNKTRNLPSSNSNHSSTTKCTSLVRPYTRPLAILVPATTVASTGRILSTVAPGISTIERSLALTRTSGGERGRTPQSKGLIVRGPGRIIKRGLPAALRLYLLIGTGALVNGRCRDIWLAGAEQSDAKTARGSTRRPGKSGHKLPPGLDAISA